MPSGRTCVVFAVLLFCAWTGEKGVAVADGAIGGRVEDSDGSAVMYVWVDAYDADASRIDSGLTDFDGLYQIPGLSNGTYYLRTDVGYENYVDEWHEDIPVVGWTVPVEALPVVVGGGLTNTVDFVLEVGGSISGRVTDAWSGAISNVWVDVYDLDESRLKSGLTGTDGRYEVFGVPPGTFLVRTDSYGQNYVDEWYDDVPVVPWGIPSEADVVVVVVSQVTDNVDFTLEEGSSISGRVTTATGSIPLPDVWVDAHDEDGSWIRSGLTGGDGRYVVEGLSATTTYARTYAIGIPYADEWYDNIPVLGVDVSAGAAALELAVGSVRTGIDFDLAPEAVISGVVTSSAGGPVSGAMLDAYTEEGVWVGSAETDGSGAYAFSRLPQGNFFLRTYAGETNLVDEWYDDVPLSGVEIDPEADVVYAQAGTTNAGIDFGLDVGGMIAGTVTETNDLPLEGVAIDVYDADTNWLKTVDTGLNGGYAVSGLRGGHPVHVRTYAGGELYVDEWYDDVPVVGWEVPPEAMFVEVDSGETTWGVDFELVRGSTISGQVMDATNGPLSGVGVVLYDLDSVPIGEDVSMVYGDYAISALPAGSYYARTFASDLNYADQWYDGVSVVGAEIPLAADAVAVAAGVTEGGVDFLLEASGTVSGDVHAVGGVPLADVAVDIYDAGTNWMAAADTDSLGGYRIPGLATPGPYYARTYASPWGYADEWYDDVPLIAYGIPAAAEALVLTSGVTRTETDFLLEVGAVLGGRVTDRARSGISDVYVDVYNAAGDRLGSTETDALGSYAFSALSPDTCFARTDSAGQGFVDEWYDDIQVSGSGVSGDGIPLTPGGMHTNIDFALDFMVVGYGVTGDLFRISWQAASGSTYRVMKSWDLTVWTNAAGGSNAVQSNVQTSAVQGVMGYEDFLPMDSNAFYAVDVSP